MKNKLILLAAALAINSLAFSDCGCGGGNSEGSKKGTKFITELSANDSTAQEGKETQNKSSHVELSVNDSITQESEEAPNS